MALSNVYILRSGSPGCQKSDVQDCQDRSPNSIDGALTQTTNFSTFSTEVELQLTVLEAPLCHLLDT